jgi:hypothetical protein
MPSFIYTLPTLYCKGCPCRFETCFTEMYLILLSKSFAIVIQQYNLMVCVDLSPIGYYPTASLRLTGMVNALADHAKGL